MSNRRRYVIMTPFAKPDVVAGICQIHGADVWVVPSTTGALIVRDLPVKEFHDWDIAELLGDDPQALSDTEEAPAEVPAEAGEDAASVAGSVPGGEEGSAGEPTRLDPGEEGNVDADDGQQLAARIAALSRAGAVLLQAELGEDVGAEAGVSGLVTASQIAPTGIAEETPAGLIVASADQLLEDLLIGETEPSEVKGAVRSGEITPGLLEKMAGRAARAAERHRAERDTGETEGEDA
ncbi:MAG: hypothetical protein Q4P33_05590 [Flaviflexus sp.]|nr:hypothetical protein [Flaviflexus sp.]